MHSAVSYVQSSHAHTHKPLQEGLWAFRLICCDPGSFCERRYMYRPCRSQTKADLSRSHSCLYRVPNEQSAAPGEKLLQFLLQALIPALDPAHQNHRPTPKQCWRISRTVARWLCHRLPFCQGPQLVLWRTSPDRHRLLQDMQEQERPPAQAFAPVQLSRQHYQNISG
ncbi:hypothetical protein D9M69_519270 [compost metagenome]